MPAKSVGASLGRFSRRGVWVASGLLSSLSQDHGKGMPVLCRMERRSEASALLAVVNGEFGHFAENALQRDDVGAMALHHQR
jgi:hypothetical protein